MSDDDLAPEEEAEVSRLLADAAPQAELPEHVAVRLDNVLAGLVAEREEPVADVVPLRGRRWPKVLVAAAAVSLFGYAGSTLLQSQSADDAGTATGEAAHDSMDGDRRQPAAAPQPVAPPGEELLSPPGALVRDEQLAMSALRSRSLSPSVVGGFSIADGTVPKALEREAGRCAAPKRNPADRSFLLDLGGKRTAVVVLHPLTGSAAVADVYLCRQSVFPVASALVLAAR